MADNQFSITCPTDCTGVYPAVADINPECPGQISRSEVSEVLFMHPTLGVGPTDWSDVTAWEAVIDNSDTTGVGVKRIYGIGNQPEATKPEIQYSNGVLVYGEGTYTLVFTVLITDETEYELLRTFECSGTPKPKIWYVTRDNNFLYGKDLIGIQTKGVSVSLPLESGDDAQISGTITFTWSADTNPDRIASPF